MNLMMAEAASGDELLKLERKHGYLVHGSLAIGSLREINRSRTALFAKKCAYCKCVYPLVDARAVTPSPPVHSKFSSIATSSTVEWPPNVMWSITKYF